MIFPRKIEPELIENLPNRRALIILGARQTGKTTLLKRIQAQIQDEKTLYFDLEQQDSIRLFKEGVDSFIQYLDDQGFSESERVVVFIDEIQYLDEFSNFIKLAVDHYSHRLKLIVSGSSAAQIKYQFKDSLVGRKFIYKLHPLSFREFVIFKNESSISKHLGTHYQEADLETLNRTFKKRIDALYHEFMIYGGYPEVVLAQSVSLKKNILEEIIQTYVLKDIRNLFTIEKINAFNHLVRILALQSGQLFNRENVGNEIKLNMRTLDRYILILADTYLIQPVKPLYSNKPKELKKMPKIFLNDTGLRNSLMNNFNGFDHRADGGELFESAIFSALWKNKGSLDELYFWRTTMGKEIDFVLQMGAEYVPFEVKKTLRKKNYLESFGKLYPCNTLNMVYLNESKIRIPDNINLIPAWAL
ncbi:MAG: ATP-binding protein [Candidatus Thioglobus sp.]|nr:ATP-binding protein [Candidatus Thioglobus sp.]